MPSLRFLGATETVTGSKYLIETDAHRVLVDCGLFQGYKDLRRRNRDPLPIDPATIDAVVLTHAHIDHSGYVPLLLRQGFQGRVICTPATLDLCAILLPDSGHLQERDAERANRHGYSRHRPAAPLYTQAEAEASLRRFSTVSYGEEISLGPGLSIQMVPAGHILGSAIVRVQCGGVSTVFSGDLGRPMSATMVAPTKVAATDFLVVESTYGDRRHASTDPEDDLAEIVNRTARRGGTTLVPSFAVGRTQALLHHLARLKAAGRIPDLPVFLDSPMAIDASRIFCRHQPEHRLTEDECRAACGVARYVTSVEESKELDRRRDPMILLSASGMLTGGRVLHHLKAFGPDPRNTILLPGFQAAGTRGAALRAGARELKIHGMPVGIQAEVCSIDAFSAHADWAEILEWLGGFTRPPRTTFVTHGERAAADALRKRIEETRGWRCTVPRYLEEASLL